MNRPAHEDRDAVANPGKIDQTDPQIAHDDALRLELINEAAQLRLQRAPRRCGALARSQAELLAAGSSGLPLSEHWKNEGDWQLSGTIVGTPVQINQQWDWRWCSKCQGMYFAGNPPPAGKCPAGASHAQIGSGNYGPVHQSPAAPGQANWRGCSKCEGMYFAGNGTLGICPTSGSTRRPAVATTP